MPLMTVNAGRPDFAALDHALRHHGDAPVIVMVHGYKFSPGDRRDCPFADIMSPLPPPRARAVSWPRHLGLGRSGAGAEPLLIGFGWHSLGSIWAAAQMARRVAGVLARVAETVLSVTGRGAAVIAHSLGARVALGAMAQAAEGAFGRVVLLTGAAFRNEARRAMNSPAGRRAEVLNVTSGENAMYDALTRLCLDPRQPTLGRGFSGALPRWLDIRIDDPATRDALRTIGLPIGRPRRRICHWSGYLRPGVFALYRRWLVTPGALPLAVLAAHLPAPRPTVWSWPQPVPVRTAT